MQATATVLVYSDDANTRSRCGSRRRPPAGPPTLPLVEFAGVRDAAAAVLTELEKGGIDVLRAWTARRCPVRRHGACAGRSRTRSSAARRCWC